MLVRLAATAALAVFSAGALAQAYPNKTVRMIVGFPPGGGTDVVARVISAKLSEWWGQAVAVENRPGATGTIGADAVAKSAPDGYTWLLAPDNVFVTNPYIAKATTFDPLTDLQPVTEVGRIQFLLVVPSSLPVTSVQELITYAKAHPGELNFGSSGNGSPQHLSAALLQLLGGIKMNHVPYKGAAPAITDLLPGRIQVWIGAANSLLPHVRDGKLKLLGSTAPGRFANLGDTPAIGEVLPGYSVDPWLGLFVPAKTPQEVVKRINAEVARILGSADVKAKMAPQGIELVTNSPEDFARFIRDEHAKWGKVIQQAGIKSE